MSRPCRPACRGGSAVRSARTPRPARTASKALPALAALLGPLLLAGLASCTKTTEVVRDGGERITQPSPEARVSNDPADVERRARLRLELAALYFSRGQTNTALEELNASMAIKSDLAESHALRGLILASTGDLRGAESSFQRALQINPRDADAMHNYGWFLCQQRRFDEADAQFRNALVQPQYGGGNRTLLAQGVCQARAGRWIEAEATLGRSYELDPANPVTAYNLSEVLLRRGELERARFYIGRVNAVPEQVTAQSLWLAVRVERQMGHQDAMLDFGRQLRNRFPQSPEALLLERGRFDE